MYYYDASENIIQKFLFTAKLFSLGIRFGNLIASIIFIYSDSTVSRSEYNKYVSQCKFVSHYKQRLPPLVPGKRKHFIANVAVRFEESTCRFYKICEMQSHELHALLSFIVTYRM